MDMCFPTADRGKVIDITAYDHCGISRISDIVTYENLTASDAAA